MKRLITLLLIAFCSLAYSQDTYNIISDTVVIKAFDAAGEFKLENATRGVTDGLLTNIGDGLTEFQLPLDKNVVCWREEFTVSDIIWEDYWSNAILNFSNTQPVSTSVSSYRNKGFVFQVTEPLLVTHLGASIPLSNITACSKQVRLYQLNASYIPTAQLANSINLNNTNADLTTANHWYDDVPDVTLVPGVNYGLRVWNSTTNSRCQASVFTGSGPYGVFADNINIIQYRRSNTTAQWPNLIHNRLEGYPALITEVLETQIVCDTILPDYVTSIDSLNDSTTIVARLSGGTVELVKFPHDFDWFPNFSEFTGDAGTQLTNIYSIGTDNPLLNPSPFSQVRAATDGVHIEHRLNNRFSSWRFGNTPYGQSPAIHMNSSRKNIFIGHDAGYRVSVSYNIGIGNNSLRYVYPTYGDQNVAIGSWAMGTGYPIHENVAIGHHSSFYTLGVIDFGQSPPIATDAIANTTMGAYSGQLISGGQANTMAGAKSGQYSYGNRNTFLGVKAGQFNGQGYNNTYLGFEAGKYTGWGRNNIFIGYQAGKNAPDNTEAELWIHNSDDPNPLVWGHFTNRIFKVNGRLEVTNGDLALKTVGNGVILRSPDSNCHKVVVDNLGVLSTTPVVCP